MTDRLEPAELEPTRASRGRRVSDAESDITPMIDMVFLLLIFFLVASKIDEATSVKLPPARHGVAVAQENAIIVIVKKGSGDNVVVVARRDGTPFSADLETQEEEIGAYVEAGMTGSPPFERPMDTIILKAEGNVKEGDVARVAQAIGRVTDTPLLNYAVVEEL